MTHVTVHSTLGQSAPLAVTHKDSITGANRTDYTKWDHNTIPMSQMAILRRDESTIHELARRTMQIIQIGIWIGLELLLDDRVAFFHVRRKRCQQPQREALAPAIADVVVAAPAALAISYLRGMERGADLRQLHLQG